MDSRRIASCRLTCLRRATSAAFLDLNNNYDSTIFGARLSIRRTGSADRAFFLLNYLSPAGRSAQCPRPFFTHFEADKMSYFIFARDGTNRIVLKRDTQDAAERKARELKDLGWFDVQIEEADTSRQPDCRMHTAQSL